MVLHPRLAWVRFTPTRGMRVRRWRSSAFTLVELLVVIAIIGVLVSLLLPAVNAAREAARRTQCINNARNVALALVNYHDVNRSFPPMIDVPDQFLNPPGNLQMFDGSRLFANWAVLMLPYIEEQALYDSFEISPTVLLSSLSNRPARGARIGIMRCPSDSTEGGLFEGNGGNWERGNYGINAGLGYIGTVDNWWKTRGWARGVASLSRTVSIRKIVDGTSKTILVAELRAGLSPRDRRGTWAMGLCGSSAHCEHGANWVRSPNSCGFGDEDIHGGQDVIADVGEDHMARNCMGVSDWDYSVQSVVRSTHPGVVIVAFCDGSMRAISDFIDTGAQTSGLNPNPWEDGDKSVYGLWQRLNSSADKLVASGDY